MGQWIKTSWKPHVNKEALLVLDLYKAQKIDHNAILLLFLSLLAAPVLSSFLMSHSLLCSRRKSSLQLSNMYRLIINDNC